MGAMLRIELSALSPQELRRLHDVARARGQAALADQLAAELDTRPRRAEDWAPQTAGYREPPPLDAPDEPARPRRSGVMAATAALAAFVSAAVTWGLSVPMTPRAGPNEAMPIQPRAAVVLASVAPVGAPTPAQSAAPQAIPATEPESSPPPVQFARATSTPSASGKANPCYDLPTAAERLVCGYPSLAAQDRQLRAAYDKAVAGGADRRELDRAQALWRGATEGVSDRKALAERYGRRIREIEATRPPPAPPPPPPPRTAPEDPPY